MGFLRNLFVRKGSGTGGTDSYLNELINTAKELQNELRRANSALFWTITGISVFFNVLAYMPIFLGNKPLEALKAVLDRGDAWTGFIVFLNALAAVVWAYAITGLQVSSLASWKISRWAKILCLLSFTVGTVNNLQGMMTAVPAPEVGQLRDYLDYMQTRLPFAFGLELLPLVFRMLGRPARGTSADSSLEEGLTGTVVDDKRGEDKPKKKEGSAEFSHRRANRTFDTDTPCGSPGCTNTAVAGRGRPWILEVGLMTIGFAVCAAHNHEFIQLAERNPIELVRNWKHFAEYQPSNVPVSWKQT